MMELNVTHTETGYGFVSIPSLIQDKDLGFLVCQVVTARQKVNILVGKKKMNAGNEVDE